MSSQRNRRESRGKKIYFRSPLMFVARLVNLENEAAMYYDAFPNPPDYPWNLEYKNQSPLFIEGFAISKDTDAEGFNVVFRLYRNQILIYQSPATTVVFAADVVEIFPIRQNNLIIHPNDNYHMSMQNTGATGTGPECQCYVYGYYYADNGFGTNISRTPKIYYEGQRLWRRTVAASTYTDMSIDQVSNHGVNIKYEDANSLYVTGVLGCKTIIGTSTNMKFKVFRNGVAMSETVTIFDTFNPAELFLKLITPFWLKPGDNYKVQVFVSTVTTPICMARIVGYRREMNGTLKFCNQQQYFNNTMTTTDTISYTQRGGASWGGQELHNPNIITRNVEFTTVASAAATPTITLVNTSVVNSDPTATTVAAAADEVKRTWIPDDTVANSLYSVKNDKMRIDAKIAAGTPLVFNRRIEQIAL